MPKAVIVIPTYRERENIKPLVERLEKQFRKIPKFKFAILFVDDNSPDGTGQAVEEISKDKKFVHLLSGKKKGLGVAYIRGFKYALKNLTADVVVEMDADLSHKPEDLPRLLSAIEKGADFVIGSRYINGGKVPSDWNFLRRANSRWGNRFARYIAGIDGVKDCTSGFRAIKKEILAQINLDMLKVQGYSFQMNLLHQAYLLGAKIKEVPIHFEKRAWGHTKIGPLDIAEFILNSLKLKFRKSYR